MDIFDPTRYTTFIVTDYDPATSIAVLYSKSIEIEYDTTWLTNPEILDHFVKNGPRMYIRLRRFGENYEQTGTAIYEHDHIATFTSLQDVQSVPLDYIPYSISGTNFNVQRDGILVLCGTSGSGKTHNALYNIHRLLTHFDELLYLNWEVTENDIKQRVLGTPRIPTFDMTKVTLSQTQSINEITKFMGDKNIAVIIDNIDNLIGASDNPFQEQLAFVKKLDGYVKDHNQHVLMLTQHVKDSKLQLFDKEGKFSNAVNLSLLSGVKQLGDMCRSAMFVSYFDGEASPGYRAKVIKKGSGRFDWEQTF